MVAPGNNKAEILRVLPELAGHFEQTVLLGYPPFVKDVVDTGLAAGFDWSRHPMKLVLAGEVFSEEWRDLVGRRLGMADPVRDTASLYGTADAGVLGNETPLSVSIRRFLAGRPELARELFGDARLPTLVQYDPASRFFEEQDGTLLFSGDSGAPLIRYHIADEGGLVSAADMRAFCARHGFAPDFDQRPAVRLRVRPVAVHGVLLRRQRVPGERRGRPRAAGGQRVGDREVRAADRRRRRREPDAAGDGGAGAPGGPATRAASPSRSGPSCAG